MGVKDRPNILFVMCDQMRADAVAALGIGCVGRCADKKSILTGQAKGY